MKNIVVLLFLLFSQTLFAQTQTYGGRANATQIQGKTVSTTAPTQGQVLAWCATTSSWQPVAQSGGGGGGSGTVTSVVSGAGLVAGTITANGTVAVDVGTAANKILQVTSGGQYPTLDGFLITNVNAANRTLSNLTTTAMNTDLTFNTGSQATIGTSAASTQTKDLYVKPGTSSAAAGGQLNLQGATGSTVGGAVTIYGGSATAASANGGAVVIGTGVPGSGGADNSITLQPNGSGTIVFNDSSAPTSAGKPWISTNSSGVAGWSSLNLGTAGSVTGLLPLANGGTGGADGFLLTNLSAAKIAVGTLSAARLSGVDGSQLTNLNASNVAVGTLSAARLNGVDGSQLTNLNAANVAVGTLSAARGGTGTSTAFTSGSVVYSGASGVYAQDNANFFWDATNHRIGIGTTTPSVALEIVGTAVAGIKYTNTNGASAAQMQFYNGGVETILSAASGAEGSLGTQSNHPLSIISNGTTHLHVSAAGVIQFNTGYTSCSGFTTDGSGVIACTASDERLKNIQGEFTSGLDALKNIKPIRYKWNEKHFALSGSYAPPTQKAKDEIYTGFSAQNVMAGIPEGARQGDNGYYNLDTLAIMATMVNAINELSEKVNTLEKKCEH